MAGTRCANPDYQLDVDTMMVEYVLYKGIEVHLEMLVTLSEQLAVNDPHNIGWAREQADSALRLTETYDSLIALYKTTHGNVLSSNTQRNGEVLQFLVQINSWAAKKIEDLEDLIPRVSKEMREKQQQHIIVTQLCRRIWLKANGGPEIMDSDSDAPSWHVRSHRLSLADHLLPLFMWISADLFEISKTPCLSFEWMKLATQFMVQAAIEVLDEPDFFVGGSEVVHNLLQECFAWGSLDRTTSPASVETIIGKLNTLGFKDIDTTVIDRVTAMEARCQEMFRERPGRGNDSGVRTSLSHGQTPSWSSVKDEALEDVLMTFTSIQEAEGSLAHRPVELLKKKYPLTVLLTEINDFISVHWQLLHSKAWHGKPILVQIEEGGIDGLTFEEFEVFKQRAGIRDIWGSTLVDDD